MKAYIRELQMKIYISTQVINSIIHNILVLHTLTEYNYFQKKQKKISFSQMLGTVLNFIPNYFLFMPNLCPIFPYSLS